MPTLAKIAEKTRGWLCLRSLWKYFASRNVGEALTLADSSGWLALILRKFFQSHVQHHEDSLRH